MSKLSRVKLSLEALSTKTNSFQITYIRVSMHPHKETDYACYFYVNRITQRSKPSNDIMVLFGLSGRIGFEFAWTVRFCIHRSTNLCKSSQPHC
jgi:hypothetical protein